MTQSSSPQKRPENRLAQFVQPGASRQKYASLTAGLLARKGEAVPATPYFSSSAFDFYAEEMTAQEAPPAAEMAVVPAPAALEPEPLPGAKPVPEPETAKAKAPAAGAARTPSQQSDDLYHWRLKRLGLSAQRPAGERKIVLRPSRPAANGHEAKDDAVLTSLGLTAKGEHAAAAKPATDRPAPLTEGATSPAAQVQAARETRPEVRLDLRLPPRLLARLCTLADKSGTDLDEVLAKALEVYFRTLGVSEGCVCAPPPDDGTAP